MILRYTSILLTTERKGFANFTWICHQVLLNSETVKCAPLNELQYTTYTQMCDQYIFWRYLLPIWIVLCAMTLQVCPSKENNNWSRWPVKAVAKTHTNGNAGQHWKISALTKERSYTSDSENPNYLLYRLCWLQTNDFLTHLCISMSALFLVSMTVHIPPERNQSTVHISKHSELASWRDWDKWLIFCDFSPECLLFWRGCAVW